MAAGAVGGVVAGAVVVRGAINDVRTGPTNSGTRTKNSRKNLKTPSELSPLPRTEPSVPMHGIARGGMATGCASVAHSGQTGLAAPTAIAVRPPAATPTAAARPCRQLQALPPLSCRLPPPPHQPHQHRHQPPHLLHRLHHRPPQQQRSQHCSSSQLQELKRRRPFGSASQRWRRLGVRWRVAPAASMIGHALTKTSRRRGWPYPRTSPWKWQLKAHWARQHKPVQPSQKLSLRLPAWRLSLLPSSSSTRRPRLSSTRAERGWQRRKLPPPRPPASPSRPSTTSRRWRRIRGHFGRRSSPSYFKSAQGCRRSSWASSTTSPGHLRPLLNRFSARRTRTIQLPRHRGLFQRHRQQRPQCARNQPSPNHTRRPRQPLQPRRRHHPRRPQPRMQWPCSGIRQLAGGPPRPPPPPPPPCRSHRRSNYLTQWPTQHRRQQWRMQRAPSWQPRRRQPRLLSMLVRWFLVGVMVASMMGGALLPQPTAQLQTPTTQWGAPHQTPSSTSAPSVKLPPRPEQLPPRRRRDRLESPLRRALLPIGLDFTLIVNISDCFIFHRRQSAGYDSSYFTLVLPFAPPHGHRSGERARCEGIDSAPTDQLFSCHLVGLVAARQYRLQAASRALAAYVKRWRGGARPDLQIYCAFEALLLESVCRSSNRDQSQPRVHFISATVGDWLMEEAGCRVAAVHGCLGCDMIGRSVWPAGPGGCCPTLQMHLTLDAPREGGGCLWRNWRSVAQPPALRARAMGRHVGISSHGSAVRVHLLHDLRCSPSWFSSFTCRLERGGWAAQQPACQSWIVVYILASCTTWTSSHICSVSGNKCVAAVQAASHRHVGIKGLVPVRGLKSFLPARRPTSDREPSSAWAPWCPAGCQLRPRDMGISCAVPLCVSGCSRAALIGIGGVVNRRGVRPAESGGSRPTLQMHHTFDAPREGSGCQWRNRRSVAQPPALRAYASVEVTVHLCDEIEGSTPVNSQCTAVRQLFAVCPYTVYGYPPAFSGGMRTALTVTHAVAWRDNLAWIPPECWASIANQRRV